MAKLRPLQILLAAVDKASAPINRLNTRIEALTAPARRVNKELDRLNKNLGLSRLRERAAGVGQAFSRLARRVALVGGALAGAAAVGFWRWLERADSIVNSADRLGIGIEAYQELAFAAQQAGVAQGSLNGGLRIFSKLVGEAGAGVKTSAGVFRSLGISIRDAGGRIKPTEMLLGEVASKIAAVEDPATRVRIAMKLFGRGGTEMITMLTGGADGLARMREEARRLGIVLSEDAARGAEDLGDEIDKVKAVAVGLFNVVASRLVPVVRQATDQFLAWARTGEGAKKLSEFADSLAAGLKAVMVWLPDAVRDSRDFLQSIGGLKTLLAAFVVVQIAPLAAAIASLAVSFLSLSTALGIGAATLAPWLALIAGAGTLVALLPEMRKHFGSPALAAASGAAPTAPLTGLAAASGISPLAPLPALPAQKGLGDARAKIDVTIKSDKPVRVDKLESEAWLDLFAETGPSMSMP